MTGCYAYGKTCLDIYVKGAMEEDTELMKTVLDVFKCPVTSFDAQRRCNPDNKTKNALMWIQDYQEKPLEEFSLCSLFSVANINRKENFEWILENVKVTKRLEVREIVDYDFNLRFIPTCKELKVFSASWITLENLLSFKECSVIFLFATKLTCKDIDTFMRNWKEGMFPKLEFLSLADLTIADDEHQILGFSKNELERTKEPSRTKWFDGKNIATCSAGVDIESEDGTKATINCRPRDWFEAVFKLFVWRD